MKYIQYTYVDVKTKQPVSKQPAKRGPVHPDGITPTFAAEKSFSTGVPTFFGIAEDTFTPEDWMVEVSEEDFYNRMKTEFKERSRKKRKQIEQGGIEALPEIFLKTDIETQNRITSLVASLNNNPKLFKVDFEVSPNNWISLSREEALQIGETLSNHVQGCFSWCKGIHDKIDLIETLEDASPVVQEMRDFKGVIWETL